MAPFRNSAYIAVRHTPEKKSANFDGYSTELHFKWKKGWIIVQNDPPNLKIRRFTVDAELRKPLVGGRIEFVLDTPSGPSAPPTFPDTITFQLATDNGPSSVQSGRDRELLLPKGTRVTSCQFEPQTQEQYFRRVVESGYGRLTRAWLRSLCRASERKSSDSIDHRSGVAEHAVPFLWWANSASLLNSASLPTRPS